MEKTNTLLQLTFTVMTDKNNGLIEIIHHHSEHSRIRACQRSMSREKITAVLQYGEVFYKQGLLFYILGEKDIPPFLGKIKDLLKNTVIVVSGNSSQLITCYRSSNPYKNIRTKTKKLSFRYKKAA